MSVSLNIKAMRLYASAAAVMLVSGVLLTGCGKEEPKTSAPGYYDGPMKPKGAAKTGTEDTTAKPGTP